MTRSVTTEAKARIRAALDSLIVENAAAWHQMDAGWTRQKLREMLDADDATEAREDAADNLEGEALDMPEGPEKEALLVEAEALRGTPPVFTVEYGTNYDGITELQRVFVDATKAQEERKSGHIVRCWRHNGKEHVEDEGWLHKSSANPS